MSSMEWSGRRDSDSRPPPWQGGALPTELLPHKHSWQGTKPRNWCGRRDSNSYALSTPDPKSGASAIPPRPHNRDLSRDCCRRRSTNDIIIDRPRLVNTLLQFFRNFPRKFLIETGMEVEHAVWMGEKKDESSRGEGDDRISAEWAKARDGREIDPRIVDFAASIPQGGAVLDNRCGTGAPIDVYLAKCGFSVTGVDFSPEMIRRRKKRFRGRSSWLAICWNTSWMRRLMRQSRSIPSGMWRRSASARSIRASPAGPAGYSCLRTESAMAP